MKFLIVGAGTIGLMHGWLLSQRHEVMMLARLARVEELRQGVKLVVRDLRRGRCDGEYHWVPKAVCDATGDYDAVLVMVNRLQLASVLPVIHPLARRCQIVFMLNHWDLKAEVEIVFAPGDYGVGFPSQVGGGREKDTVNAIVFPQGTLLSKSGSSAGASMDEVREAFLAAGLKVKTKGDLLDWLKVHYLQQSITAAAVAKAGSYDAFAHDRGAVRDMAVAFREGIEVCRRSGVDVRTIFPAPLFRLPVPLVTFALQRMLTKPETRQMVTEHMRCGFPEWAAGYTEVLVSGERLGVSMPQWASYRSALESKFLRNE